MTQSIKDFESAIAELEKIVKQLEDGDLALDKSLALFERGIELSRYCHDQLGAAQRRIEVLSERGQLTDASQLAEGDNDLDNAIAYYKQALAFNPGDTSLQQSLMLSLMAQKPGHVFTSDELAAKLLTGLLGVYKGALAPTVASYNADKERVQIWWNAAKGLPEELFIDSIPYQQTRAYVRQVLTNYAMYQRSAQSTSPKK